MDAGNLEYSSRAHVDVVFYDFYFLRGIRSKVIVGFSSSTESSPVVCGHEVEPVIMVVCFSPAPFSYLNAATECGEISPSVEHLLY